MLRNVHVHTLASRAVVVDPAATIRQLVDDYVLEQNSRFVLVMRAEELLRIITLTNVKRAPRESRELERVTAWMTRYRSRRFRRWRMSVNCFSHVG